MKKYPILVGLAMMITLGGQGVGRAASVTTTLPVSATLVAGCSVQTAGINFGNVVSGSAIQPQDATGLVTVTCAGSSNYVVYMGAGTRTGGTTRGMAPVSATTGATLRYNIYQDAAHTILWGDAGGGDTFSAGTGLAGTGNGLAQSLTVYGRILLDITPPTIVGNYTDTVLVTLVF